MADKPTSYHRIPGRRTRLLSRDTLWLGPDHLLAVHSLRYTEYYRRFYFRDVQAICVRRRKGNRLEVLDGVISFVALFLGAIISREHPILAALCLIALLLYLSARMLRPSCETWIQTALGAERLPSLCRIRTVRRALQLIEPSILNAQADIAAPPEPVSEPLGPPPLVPTATAIPGATFAGTLPPPLPAIPATVEGWRARVPAVAFAGLVLCGGLKFASPFLHWERLTGLFPLAYLACVLLLVASLVFGPKPRGNQLAALIASLIVSGYVAMMSWSIYTAQVTQPDQNAKLINQFIRDMTGARIVSYIAGGLLICLGLWGLLAFSDRWLPQADTSPATAGLFGSDQR